MEVGKVLHMNGGIRATSYANNSLLQQKAILMTKPIAEEAIYGLYHSLFPIGTLCIADLGCSSGPNTFLAISHLIKTVISKNIIGGQPRSPKFHIFLNDLPGNDFNTIFRSLLPEFQEDMKEHGCGTNCFVTGVPGSFYGRLFPSNSLHFVHSSYSLHWLSQVPDRIGNNKGNICMANTSPANVMKAYYGQFEKDFINFLKCRSEELVNGGRMVLTLLGRKSEHLSGKESSYAWELLAKVLNELVAQGLIEEEKVDSFNIPNYYPSPIQVMNIVAEKEGSFTIDCLETSEIYWYPSLGKCLRAVVEPLLVSHFGIELMDQVFEKYTEIIADSVSKEKPKFINVTISLTKKHQGN